MQEFKQSVANLHDYSVGTEKRREKVDSYRMRSEGSILMEWSIWSIPDHKCYVVVTIS